MFQLQQQWINAFVWVSTFLVALAAALAPHDAEPASLLFSLGAPWLAVAVAVRIFQRRTRRAARRAVEPDRRAYDALWQELLADPGPLAALEAAALQVPLRPDTPLSSGLICAFTPPFPPPPPTGI